jgi:hypothetical protein
MPVQNPSPKQKQKNFNLTLPKLDQEQLAKVAGGPVEIRELVIKVNVSKNP